MRILLISPILFLSACASAPQSPDPGITERAIAAGRVEIPDDWRKCSDEPISPGGKATNRQTAEYIIDLIQAGRDCRIKIGAIDKALR